MLPEAQVDSIVSGADHHPSLFFSLAMTEPTQMELVAQAKSGDRSALSRLLLIHYDRLHFFISGRISADLQGIVRADDILQQAFVRVANSIGTFEPRSESSFCSWLKTIVANLVRDAERRRFREKRARRIDGSSQDAGLGLAELAACEGTSPSSRASRNESLHRMRVAMASLPSEQRNVIQKYYLDGDSLAEIAQEMGRTKGAVRGICYRARQNMRAIIGGSSLYFSSGR